jgi:hypothetical protein
MHQSLIKRIVLLFLSGFFLAVVGIVFYDDDDTFLLRSRSICQVRTAISGTMSKNHVDSAPAVMAVYLGLESIFPLCVSFSHKNTTIFISSQVACLYSNRAPPIRS